MPGSKDTTFLHGTIGSMLRAYGGGKTSMKLVNDRIDRSVDSAFCFAPRFTRNPPRFGRHTPRLFVHAAVPHEGRLANVGGRPNDLTVMEAKKKKDDRRGCANALN